MIQKGGMLMMAFIAIGGLLLDRKRLLKALHDKDERLAKKDDQLLALSERTVVVMAELKLLLGGRSST